MFPWQENRASFNLFDASWCLRELEDAGQDSIKWMLQKSEAVQLHHVGKNTPKLLQELFFSAVHMCLALSESDFQGQGQDRLQRLEQQQEPCLGHRGLSQRLGSAV
ncbi:Hypothetical predicted protein, partial [Marmota monax]